MNLISSHYLKHDKKSYVIVNFDLLLNNHENTRSEAYAVYIRKELEATGLCCNGVWNIEIS